MSNDCSDYRSQSWPWPPELDALVAAPNSHRLLLDHARVRVLEVTVPPGVTEQGPGQVAIRPHLSDDPMSLPSATRPRWSKAGRQIPVAGMFGHLVQTATLPEPCRGS
jgi:hypothetical protein